MYQTQQKKSENKENQSILGLVTGLQIFKTANNEGGL